MKRARRDRKGITYEPWSEEDDMRLIELSDSLPDKEIAIQLGRTEYAITNRRFTLREKGIIKDL